MSIGTALRAAVLAAVGVSVGAVRTARADTPRDTPAAVEIDRAGLTPGRTELGFDGGAPLEGWGATLALGWIERPIVLRSATGESSAVERRATLALGGAVALGHSVLVDAWLPMSRQSGERLQLDGDPRALDRWVPGDLRVGARIRVVRGPRGAAFVRGELSLPTGDERDFAGEPRWTAAWNLIGRLALPRGISVAVSAGIRLRGAEVLIADRVVGDELFGGVGASLPIPPIRPLWCVADQVKLTAELVGILGDDVANKRGPSPAEARIGLVTRPREDVTLGVRIGAGLSDEIGAPAWRALFELTYQGRAQLIPPAPPEPASTDDGDPASDIL